MRLTPFEVQSALWAKLTEHYTPTLAKHRARLENPAIDERERIGLQWQIKVLKDFLALAEPERKKESAQS